MANRQLESWLDLVSSQIAAEAFLGRAFGASDEEARVLALGLGLQIGNINNSRFPFDTEEVPSAFTDAYARRYELVAYQDLSFGLNNGVLNGYSDGANLAPSKSGFAAVLLRDRLAEPGNSQYVLSVRSTEFAESIRDLGDYYAGLEIKLLGASLGQLGSLNRFFSAARMGEVAPTGQGDLGKLSEFSAYMAAGGKVNLTGYSLGGELATLFSGLRSDDIGHVTLVNAAGTGIPRGLPAAPSLIEYQAAVASTYAQFQSAFSDPQGYWNSLSASQQVTLKTATLRTGIGQVALRIAQGLIGGAVVSYRAYELLAAQTSKSLMETLLSFIQSGSLPPMPAGRDHGIYDDPGYLFASIAATSGWVSGWKSSAILLGQSSPEERPRVATDRVSDLYGFSSAFSDLSRLIVSRSALRIGNRSPIYIEEQARQRFPESLINSDVKWDFGDGHSIVLLR